MTIIRLTTDNIDDEHICCAISDKKCQEGYAAKKKWLRARFADGYTFKKLDVRGKVFIEYVPAEKAWCPISAANDMLINCFWVSGQYKGKGHGKALLGECIKDSKGKNGIAVVTANKKQPFMSDRKFFQKQGFELCDTALPYFELWYKRLKKNAAKPKFKDCAKNGTDGSKTGMTVYYTNACPFTEYYVQTELTQVAQKRGKKLKIVKITSRKQAQNHFVPHTIYSVFNNGVFVTQHILNEKNFDRFIVE